MQRTDLLNTVLLLVAILLLVLIMCGVGVTANPNVW